MAHRSLLFSDLIRDLLWILFLPSALLWAVGANIRNYFAGQRSFEKTPPHVICVGSIFAGGSGKTPVVEAVVGFLGREKVAIIQRGYRGARTVESEELMGQRTDGVTYYGDEAWQVHARTGARVWVGPKREESISKVGANKIPVAICDDGLQNPSFRKDTKIVVISSRQIKSGAYHLPMGNLRAPPKCISRCDAVVVSGAPRAEKTGFTEVFMRAFPNVPVFNAETRFAGLWDGECPVQNDRPAIAFCGIGDPTGFEQTLKDHCPEVSLERMFANHAQYGEREVNWLATKALDRGVKRLITTDKDWYKVVTKLKSRDLEVVSLRISLDLPDSFWRLIRERVFA